MDRKVAFWLIPATPAKAYLEQIIASLAEQHDAPIFEPHVTVYLAGLFDETNASELLRNASHGIPPVHLRVSGLSFSEQFTKTFFIEFQLSNELAQMHDRLKTALNSEYELKPHLSLIYKELPAAVTQELANKLVLPWGNICFGELAAIATPPQTRSARDVEQWQLIAKHRLG